MHHFKPLTQASRKETYEQLLRQYDALLGKETNLVANLANTAAAIKETFDFFWVGFYGIEDKELVLGPFQGPVACTRIGYGKGVCGKAWAEKKTIIVKDVHAFDGHIACSDHARAEIVVPAFRHKNVFLVLDIDSDKVDDFGVEDQHYLERLIRRLEKTFV